MRINILLECAETGERLYLTSKNKRNNPERLELKNILQNYVNTLFSKKLKSNFEKSNWKAKLCLAFFSWCGREIDFSKSSKGRQQTCGFMAKF